jgi:hypothetical protein
LPGNRGGASSHPDSISVGITYLQQVSASDTPPCQHCDRYIWVAYSCFICQCFSAHFNTLSYELIRTDNIF